MDTISYAYADEAHTRLDDLELIVTKAGDSVSLTGDVFGTSTVLTDGSIELVTIVSDDSHNHTVDTIIGLQDLVSQTSPLISVTEGDNNGYRLYGKEIENYGVIGEQAIDLSHSVDIYEPNGAIGDYSFVTGFGTTAKNNHSFATGKYNKGRTDTVLEVGVGTDKDNRQNALEVYEDGRIDAPNLTNDKITNDQTLVTKRYIDYLIIDCGTF